MTDTYYGTEMNRPHQAAEEANRGIGGVRVAIVTDNEDEEDLGRVKLEYPWRDEDDESYWARIATDMTGDDYGTYYLPEVEDEVLVAFENGDIHNPIVIGSLWNGNRKPPEDNSDGENDIRMIKTRSGHVVEFNDEDDGAVRIETAGGHEVVMDDDKESIKLTDMGGNTIEMDGKGDEISIDAGDTISLSAQTIEIAADMDVEIEGGTGVEIEAGAQMEIESGGMLDIESTGLLGVQSSAIVDIDGALIQLN